VSEFDDAYYQRFYGKDGAHDRERIDHLATATGQLLYLELPTKHDLRYIVDPTGTDL
jgi:hypothetical protein